MKNTIKFKNDTELVREYQDKLDDQILDCLIQKYEAMLVAIVKKHIVKYKNIDYDDCLQNAKIAAIYAIKNFNFSKENKLSTYIYFKVAKYLLTCNDEQNFIKCPSHMREVKSYIAGKYDLDKVKKQNFEKKYQIKDLNDIKNNYILLSDNAIISAPDEALPEQVHGSELNYVNFVNSTIFIKSLPKDEQIIVTLLIEGHSQNKISKILKNATSKQINTKINSIRKKFVKYYYG